MRSSLSTLLGSTDKQGVEFYGSTLARPAMIRDETRKTVTHGSRENAVNGLLGGIPEKKVKAPKLPAKWRTPQELYAEDKLAWNLTETGSSAKASGVAALRKSILQDTVAKWNSISAEDRQPFEDKAAAERERYEKHVEQWNAARPDDRLVIGKAGYATRKAKSRVDEEKKARREAERAAKKERAAKRKDMHTIKRLPKSCMDVALSAKKRIDAKRAKVHADKAGKAAAAKMADIASDDSSSEEEEDAENAMELDAASSGGSDAEDAHSDASDDPEISSDDDGDVTAAAPAAIAPAAAEDATAAGGTQPDKKVKVEPKVGAKQKAVKKAGAGGGFDGAPAKRAPARSACEGTDAAPATDSAQPLPAEQGSKAARKSSLAGAKDAPTPTKSKTRGTSDGKAASESVQPSKEKRKRGDKAGAAQADGKSADAHVAVVDASTTAAKSAGTPDAALEKPAKERKRETPDSSDARENRATRSNAKATRSQDSARTPSPTERAAAGSAKGTGGKDKAAPKAGKAAKAARKPAVKEAASLDAGLLSRKRSRLSRADATAAAGSPGSEAGGEYSGMYDVPASPARKVAPAAKSRRLARK